MVVVSNGLSIDKTKMLKVGFILFFAATALAKPAHIQKEDAVSFNTNPVVDTPQGQLRGERLSCGLFCNYYSFKGIPYAVPPVGELRFRQTSLHQGWTGVRDASEHGPVCPSGSRSEDYSGDEDCLFANVYTQSLTGKRPVMVWIHGGSFTGGSGNSWMYGPDYFVDEGVLLVTVNYRLGVLGFMSTGDKHAPGNYGIKDLIVALQWVKQNIAAFGGDPDNVTIFGESAGGCLVHYLTMSPLANDLYHKAIIQSGTALVPWGYQDNPLAAVTQLAKDMGLTFTDTEDLVNQMRTMSPGDFIKATRGWTALTPPRGQEPFDFAPTRDAPDSEEPIVIPDAPLTLMKEGRINDKPTIIGQTDSECLFMVHEFRVDKYVFDHFDNNPHYFAPRDWNVEPHSDAANDISQQVRNTYWGNARLSDDIMLEWTDYQTDALFSFGIDQTVRHYTEKLSSNVYHYIFSYHGSLNLVRIGLLLNRFERGAVHADEIPYQFSVTNMPIPILPGNHALRVRRELNRLWTNFARAGNPTPSRLDTVLGSFTWSPDSGNGEYLDIGETLEVRQRAFGPRMALWYNLLDKYGPK